MGGGQVIVRNGEVIAAFPMPVLGLFSDRPFSEVLTKRKEIAEAARAIGCNINDPLLKLEFAFAAAEFPHLRMSEEGLCARAPARGWPSRSTRERRRCGEKGCSVLLNPHSTAWRESSQGVQAAAAPRQGSGAHRRRLENAFSSVGRRPTLEGRRMRDL